MLLKDGLKYYLANLIFVWIAIGIYRFNHYYKGLLGNNAQEILLYLAIAYTLSLPLYLIFTPKEPSKGYTVFKMAYSLFASRLKRMPDKQERDALLFICVKFFFLPLMVHFAADNYFATSKYIYSIDFSQIFTVPHFLYIIYPLTLSLIFFIDTLYFTFGYVAEAGFLNNRVRSVEQTFLGWAAALICYPPFSGFVGDVLSWYPNDYAEYGSEGATVLFRIVILLLLLVYLWATLALGTRCSNLTNRGIVCKGPYAFVRHPAYISKNLAWWLTIIPVMSFQAFLSMSFWSIVYLIRAITEERHLRQDPDYREYCSKVKYRLILFVW